MATIYLRSTDGNDADNGSTWALAKVSLAAAVTAAGDGGLVYVSQVHDEAQGSAMTVASSGAITTPCRILCVNDGAEPPTALATTAIVSTNGNYGITLSGGYAYVYGVNFITDVGVGTGTAADFSICTGGTDTGWTFDTCTLRIASTGNSALYAIGTASTVDCFIHMINTTMKFSHASSYVSLSRCTWIWEKTPTNAIWGTVPTTKVIEIGAGANIMWRGLDLSPLTSSSYLFSPNADVVLVANIQNCKLGGVVMLASGEAIMGNGDVRIDIGNCSSADNTWTCYHYRYPGSIITVDNCKLNADYSLKMISLATGPTYHDPLVSPTIAQWNATVNTSFTATVEIISTATLLDDEIWLEIEYPYDLATPSVTPLSSFANDRHTHHIVSLVSGVGSGTAQDASTAAWTEDLASEIKQKLVVTFTPQNPGYIIGRVMLAKANQTVYIDPYMTIAAA